MKKLFIVLGVCVMFSAGTATGQATQDTFFVTLDGDGEITSGGGSGYNQGEWYWYPNTEWYNQWFYDHPFTYDKYKVIDVAFDITFTDVEGSATVCLNWSLPAWSALQQTRPPLPSDCPDLPTELQYIGRSDALTLTPVSFAGGLGPHHVVAPQFVIDDYNPEWISVDIRGGDVVGSGVIEHDCIPEPATLLLLCLGAGGAMLRRRR